MTNGPINVLQDSPHVPEEELELQMIREIDAFLGHPPRQHLEAGALLFPEDIELDSIWILLQGQVRLTRNISGEEVIFHSQTVGRIIGLLAFATRHRSFFACRAVTPITLLRITFTDLARALDSSPPLLALFSSVLLRSMARRNRRLVELQTEVITLNHEVENERDQLQKTLQELRQAQALLVETEKMATLGQLAAGVAHELNNPVAAIARAADFLQLDMETVANELPSGEVFRERIRFALEQKPVSTREQREQRSRLAAALKDEDLARRLVEIGLDRPEEFERLAHALRQPKPQALERLERYHQLGASLRNIDRCARRISELVRSLRAYARADASDGVTIDVHEGLEDTLRLLAHRMRDVEVDRQYGNLPRIDVHGGELNQVWTNLVANALDAMQNRGRIIVKTETVGADQIAVHIIDNGPGIPPENIDRIFDLRFTTRQGRVEFGLGLGLTICRNIIARHGGAITVKSVPGCTEFCVTLPVSKPPEPSSKENQP